MESMDDFKALIGAWTDAIGTILSAMAEIRAYIGLDEWNNQMVAIGEGLQALGSMIIGTATEESTILFAGNWIDGTGAATSSYAAYLRQIEGENDQNISLEIIGDGIQSMGAAIAAYGDYKVGEMNFVVDNSLQSLGAGIEAIAGTYELNNHEKARLLGMIGASIQASGSNLSAIKLTQELFGKEKDASNKLKSSKR